MVRLFLTAATMWFVFLIGGMIAEHQSFQESLKPATVIALLILCVPFLPRM
ncbi:MAG: hypothetical protein WDN02_13975 [Methylovirgula sp.]|uniref:hypothetical protein n=1 Tax=Methylovirgula sp. TaxID=1978224 RepID=UPI0030761EC9